MPLRQEQLKERLGERFRELDVPLLVEWPDGRREALLFVMEEESAARRFSPHRLAHYCLDLSELIGTERVVPVVIFLRGSGPPPKRYQSDFLEEADTMTSFAERFRREGMEQGMEQGMQEGVQQGVKQGETQMLLRLLRLKFGALPDAVCTRINAADSETLLVWSDRVLTATTLDEVLG